MTWPAPDPAAMVESLATPVHGALDAITSARLADRLNSFEWRPWRLTSDKFAEPTMATSALRERVPGPTPHTLSAPPDVDAAETFSGTLSAPVSRSVRRERDACRGVGRAPTRTDDGRQICGWCGEMVEVTGDRCGPHKRPQKITYIASIRIGGRDG